MFGVSDHDLWLTDVTSQKPALPEPSAGCGDERDSAAADTDESKTCGPSEA